MPSDSMISSPLDIPRVISHATTRIQTEVLQEKGVGDLRILSQSKFLFLVKKIVEATVEAHLAELEERESPEIHPLIDKASETAIYHVEDDPKAWGNQPFPEGLRRLPPEPDQGAAENQLRSKALDGIESRLASLDEAVQGMEAALGGVDDEFRLED